MKADKTVGFLNVNAERFMPFDEGSADVTGQAGGVVNPCNMKK
jgi:hypothetical protein